MNLTRILEVRQLVLDTIRRFLKDQGFTEVETPLLVRSPGTEPHLDPFLARGTATGRTAYLPTSPEYAMKKLLAAGSGNIFQICKAFRDERPTEHHLPEFTLLEWYRAGADYYDVMEDCEQICAAAAQAACGSHLIVWRGTPMDLNPPFARLTVREAFRRFAGLDLRFNETADELRSLARSAACTDVAPDDDWDEVFFKVFLRHVEPRLGRGRPTILCDYPARMAALSRLKPNDPLVCERFELYAGGLELANAFTELTDAAEQSRRIEMDNSERRRLGRPELPVDEDLLAAMERGLPDCSGIAFGIDRLIMLLTDTPDVRDVVPLAPQS